MMFTKIAQLTYKVSIDMVEFSALVEYEKYIIRCYQNSTSFYDVLSVDMVCILCIDDIFMAEA